MSRFLNDVQVLILSLGLQIRNDELVGLIPSSSTISQQLTGVDFAIKFHNVPIQFTTLSV